MTDLATLDAPRRSCGVLSEPATLTITHRLPGPMERIWAYLTESNLGRQWLAAGEMPLDVGATFELVRRNDELIDPPARPAAGRARRRAPHAVPDHRGRSTATAGLHLGRRQRGVVRSRALGSEVLLTLHHRRLQGRPTMLNVGAGCHSHLDVLVVRAAGKGPAPFWDGRLHLKQDCDRRLLA